jgi:hypothetical protein
MSLALHWCPLRGYTLAGFSLALKYQTREEVNGSGKRSGLLSYGNDYVRRVLEYRPLVSITIINNV